MPPSLDPIRATIARRPLLSASLFVLYVVLLRLGYDEQLVKTFIFAAFGTYTLLVALSLRRLHKSILAYSPLSNKYMTAGVATGYILMAIAIYVPALQPVFNTVSLPAPWAIGVLLIGVANIVLIEIAKKAYGNKHKY